MNKRGNIKKSENNKEKESKSTMELEKLFHYIFLCFYGYGVLLAFFHDYVSHLFGMFLVFFIPTSVYCIYLIVYLIYRLIKKKSLKQWKKYTIWTFVLLAIFYLFFVNLLTTYTVGKPMIYLYPEEDNTNITIRLSNPSLLTTTYPKYQDEWNVIADRDGNLYDLDTQRNYYGLYWEGLDNSKIDKSTGFVVKGEDTSQFLEEKLELLGLNEREMNEFIIYWLPKLEKNKYNYIRFRTTEEVNEYMRIDSNVEFCSMIRIIMDYIPLSKPKKIKEQKLEKIERCIPTLVEWGGREIS